MLAAFTEPAMNEMQLSGFITILSALPGLGFGLAMLMGRWKPASLATARNPDRARIATGLYCVMVACIVQLLGIGLLLLPVQMLQIGPSAAGIVVAVALLGLVPLLQATKV